MLDGTDLLWTSNIRVEVHVSLKCSILKGMMAGRKEKGNTCGMFAEFCIVH